MGEHLLRGLPASPGRAAGPARVAFAAATTRAAGAPAEELERARHALAAAAAELEAVAERLRTQGRAAEADIVDTGVLMAADPALDIALEAATTAGSAAEGALLAVTAEQADVIAALDDALLAERAADVRSLGRRAARLASGGAADAAPLADAILVADDLGPADVAELDGTVAGVALAGGGPSAHAAVVARGLGIPMVVGLGAGLRRVAPGAPLVIDGDAGTAVLDPASERVGAASAAQDAARRARERARADRALAAVTRDGHVVRVLVNAATAGEAAGGIDAGAEGAGLVRTELAFLDAADWPEEAAHRRALDPVLAPLAGRTATVRVLDFGADKTPPFLRGTPHRGLALLLAHPDAFDAQLRAILAAGAGTELRVLLPLVANAAEVRACRDRLARLAAGPVPPLGAMIETVEAAGDAAAIAAASDFLSIGTNDLTAAAFGADRFAPSGVVTHDPRVLRLIAAAVDAAERAGTFVEVCGEAASDPLLVPVLVGLGVRELSVGAARVGAVRAWIRTLDRGACARAAREALRAGGPDAVAALSAELLAEAGEAVGERADRGDGVLALRAQP